MCALCYVPRARSAIFQAIFKIDQPKCKLLYHSVHPCGKSLLHMHNVMRWQSFLWPTIFIKWPIKLSFARTACPTKVQTLFLALHASYRIEIVAETGDECYSLNCIITSQICTCTCLLHYIHAGGKSLLLLLKRHTCLYYY